MKILELAVKMFNAYNEDGLTPWKTFDGRDVPRWEALNDSVRSKWRAAKTAASESNDVLEFMRKFGQTFKRGEPHDDRSLNAEIPFKPRHLTERKLRERHNFMAEELNEFRDAALVQDLEGLADALVDLVYVAKGTANLMGLPWEELWADVHRANMEKVRGIGSRGNLVDCIKPPGWNPPNTKAILEAAGYPGYGGEQWDDPEHCPGGEQTRDGVLKKRLERAESIADLPFDPERTRGLDERKFYVVRNDGSSRPGGKHDGCEHFVLDLKHDKFARTAMLSYADSCADEYPLLAADLRAKANALVDLDDDDARKKSLEGVQS